MIYNDFRMNFKEFLFNRFMTWQTQQGHRKTVSEFADYLGVSQPLVSMWLNGKGEPNKTSARALAPKLGMEVFDVLGEERPNENLLEIEANWENLSPEAQEEIRKKVMKLAKKK